jgi:multicomponent Na+:H+ antiporter subunit D
MSGFTTKSAVYALARGYHGWEVLIFVGVIMALYGMVYAVMATDIRRLLAYHIVSQVGFMVAGLGVAGEEALEAVASHAFTHVAYKGLLVMGAGAVLYATGKSKMTDLGGLAGRMKAVLVLYMIGAFSISAFPAFAGFVSKPLVTEAVKGYSEYLAFGLYIASVGTFLHTGLKLPYFTFFGPKRDTPVEIVRKVPLGMYAGMIALAALCLGVGSFPGWLYDQLHFAIHPERYTASEVVHTLELLAFTAIGFWALRSWLTPHDYIFLDTDWFYRKPARPLATFALRAFETPFALADRAVAWLIPFATRLVTSPVQAWSRLLALRGDPSAVAALLARPPLGAAIAFIFVTFAVVLLLASAFR